MIWQATDWGCSYKRSENIYSTWVLCYNKSLTGRDFFSNLKKNNSFNCIWTGFLKLDLDRVFDVIFRWDFQWSCQWMLPLIWHHLKVYQELSCPPGLQEETWRTGGVLTGFLMSYLDETFKEASLIWHHLKVHQESSCPPRLQEETQRTGVLAGFLLSDSDEAFEGLKLEWGWNSSY